MRRNAILLLFLLVASANASHAQVTVPRPENGRLTETTTATRAEVAIVLTDKGGNIIDGSRSDTREIGTGPGLQNSTTFRIPDVFINPNTGASTDVVDVRQALRIVEKSGEISDLMLESVIFDPNTGQLLLGNIFGVEADILGFDREALIPDLFADTNKDGTIGDGDVLYSLVDFNVYLRSISSFSEGEAFDIVNGTAAELPGMMFSSSPFLFDPATGFSGTAFSGLGIVEGQHGATAVPEPGTFGLCGIATVFLFGYHCCRRRKTSAVGQRSVYGAAVLPTVLAVMLFGVNRASALSLTFTPAGAQLDGDPILDIATTPGAMLTFRTRLDTLGIVPPPMPAGVVSVAYTVTFDPTELSFVGGVPTPANPFPVHLPIAAGPGTVVPAHQGAFVPAGLIPTLDDLTFMVLPGLVNDGLPDVDITGALLGIVGVVPAGVVLVTNEVEVQPEPEPATLLIFGTSLMALLILSWRGRVFRFTTNLPSRVHPSNG
jgi:hypothetical protein